MADCLFPEARWWTCSINSASYLFQVVGIGPWASLGYSGSWFISQTISLCVCVRVCARAQVCAYARVYVGECVGGCVCGRICVYVGECVCAYVCLFVCVSVCMCVCCGVFDCACITLALVHMYVSVLSNMMMYCPWVLLI